jgi:hypothetical protein
MSRFAIVVIASSAAAFLVCGGYVILPGQLRLSVLTERNDDGRIKGDISIDGGEKIDHLPGQDHDEATIIRPE